CHENFVTPSESRGTLPNTNTNTKCTRKCAIIHYFVAFSYWLKYRSMHFLVELKMLVQFLNFNAVLALMAVRRQRYYKIALYYEASENRILKLSVTDAIDV